MGPAVATPTKAAAAAARVVIEGAIIVKCEMRVWFELVVDLE